jgi:putative tryptophan/tyrosine transport system substrate-binding protein
MMAVREEHQMPVGRTNRREFIAALSGVAAWPLVARGQQAATPVIGFLSGASRDGTPSSSPGGFRQGLAEAGYVEGRNLTIEYRWANAHFDRLQALAEELVSRRVTLIATVTLPAALAAKSASPTTPVVFVIGEDPVKAGLVASLDRPGGNATGVSDFVNQLVAKRLELIQQAVSRVESVGMLVNPKNPNVESDSKEMEAAVTALGKKLLVVRATNDQELEAAFAALAEERASVLCVNIDPFLIQAQDRITSLAASYSLPAIYPLREFVDAGGLMSYSPNRSASWRQAGRYAGRILRGERPADLPVQQATNVELVINLKTAKALGFEIPPQLLARADEVIE